MGIQTAPMSAEEELMRWHRSTAILRPTRRGRGAVAWQIGSRESKRLARTSISISSSTCGMWRRLLSPRYCPRGSKTLSGGISFLSDDTRWRPVARPRKTPGRRRRARKAPCSRLLQCCWKRRSQCAQFLGAGFRAMRQKAKRPEGPSGSPQVLMRVSVCLCPSQPVSPWQSSSSVRAS